MNDELPFAKSWWIDPGKVIGGCYPGTLNSARSRQMLERLLDAGVRTVINLQEADECGDGGEPFPDYATTLSDLAAARGVTSQVLHFPIADMKTPTAARMRQIVDAIDQAVRAGERVYVHCWGGHGRTGTVAMCWLKQGGMSCGDALNRIESARRHDAHLAQHPSPQTAEQRAFAREW